MVMKGLVRFAALAALILPGISALQLPDGTNLLKQSREAMQKYHSLQFTTDASMQMKEGGHPMTMNSETAESLVNPGKIRQDMKVQGFTMMNVSNGEFTWMYNSIKNEFTKKSAALSLSAMRDGSRMQGLPDLSAIRPTDKTLRAETIEVDGQKHDCWVVESRIDKAAMPGMQSAEIDNEVTTQWIDKQLGIVLKTTVSLEMTMPGASQPMQMQELSTTRNLKVDEPIPDSTFTFVPPANAKQVDGFSSGGASEIAGSRQPAPAFDVTALSGTSYSLAALKGSPVLLDFWASWCGPCRESIPAVRDIYQKYKDQGLVVLGIDAGEDRTTVEAFLKTTPMEYPVALSGDTDVLDDFHVSAFPTFILIGRDGRVAGGEIGYGGAAALTEILSKAGLTAPATASSDH